MIKKPHWLRVPYVDSEKTDYISGIINELNLNTVCIEANCPNTAECFSKKTATFMILGTNCTRNCSFCNVSPGIPTPVDDDEPQRIALAVKKLRLKYVVITSVTRDDLPDRGASHFADVIKEVHKTSPETQVEVLIPDLSELKIITDCSPSVIGHNIETVKSLYPVVRPESDYNRSLNVLKNIKQINPEIMIKSGLMLGLGETEKEILETFDDLLYAGCDFLTIGQYLSPGKDNYPVQKYIEPDIFCKYGETAIKKGFKNAISAPFVRSSYNAEKHYHENFSIDK